MNDTLDYYNQNAQSFFEQTYSLEMENLYTPFLSYLAQGALILDLGCGSGRDTLAFKNKGYCVEAMDWSIELVKRATQLSGVMVKQQSFYDLVDQNKYDGVWACTSLLHCERIALPDVLRRIVESIKPSGICYLSFKYGITDRKKDGRIFIDINEQQLVQFIKPLNVITLKQRITLDQRPDRNEKWINIIFKKVE